jgi:hypothetical protein
MSQMSKLKQLLLIGAKFTDTEIVQNKYLKKTKFLLVHYTQGRKGINIKKKSKTKQFIY